MQRVKAGIGQRRKCIRTAGKIDLSFTRADQIAGVGHAHRARCAGVDDVGRLAGCAQLVRYVTGDGRSGHFENVRLVLLAPQQAGIIVIDACGTADAAAEDNARIMQVALRELAVLHGLLRGLQAQAHRAVILRCGQRIAVHLGADMGNAALCGNALDLADAAHALADIVPAGRNVIARSADQAEAGDNITAHCSMFAAT